VIVMKFGGSSVATADRIRNVGELIKRAKKRQPVVVVSALGGVTDLLIQLAHDALNGGVVLGPLLKRHTDVCHDLRLPSDLCAPHLFQLEDLLRGISLVGELTPRSLDTVMSFGERMSSTIVAAHLTATGLPARALPGWEAGIVTDSNYGDAAPLPLSYRRIPGRIKKLQAKGEIPIITGFIAHDGQGNITTLGRDGSDFSASIVGAALQVREIQIWSDVSGIMSADPSVIADAEPIPSLNFEEAGELAYYGARVLHPASLLPAVERNIPVRVLNTLRPDHPGTVILKRRKGREGEVKSIAYKEDQYLINVVATRMFGHHGFMARLFEVFNRHQISVNQIGTSEISVSLTVDSDSGKAIKDAAKELSKFATVEVTPHMTVVCIVGSGIRDQRDIPARVFAALDAAGVTPVVISQGATRVSLSFLIDNADIADAIRALHKELFTPKKRATRRPAKRAAKRARNK
jgi:aspartate kinase